LLIASLQGSEQLLTILDGMSEDELFQVAVQSRNRKVLDVVIAEADRRALPTDPRAMEAVKYALMRHRYLIEAIGSSFAAEESIVYYQNVLQVSHRRRLTSADIEEILADLDRPPQTFLLAIVAQSAPGTASTLLYALAGGAVREFGLTGTSVAGSIKAGLDRMTTPEDEDRPRRLTALIGASIIIIVAAAAIALWLWL
jgi:hypothetical protein